jgi:hypothetical protein
MSKFALIPVISCLTHPVIKSGHLSTKPVGLILDACVECVRNRGCTQICSDAIYEWVELISNNDNLEVIDEDNIYEVLETLDQICIWLIKKYAVPSSLVIESDVFASDVLAFQDWLCEYFGVDDDDYNLKSVVRRIGFKLHAHAHSYNKK